MRFRAVFLTALFCILSAGFVPSFAATVAPKPADPCPKPQTDCPHPAGSAVPDRITVLAPLSGPYGDAGQEFLEGVREQVDNYRRNGFGDIELTTVDAQDEIELSWKASDSLSTGTEAVIAFDPTGRAPALLSTSGTLRDADRPVVLAGRSVLADAPFMQISYDLAAVAETICSPVEDEDILIAPSVPREVRDACSRQSQNAEAVEGVQGVDAFLHGMFPKVKLLLNSNDFDFRALASDLRARADLTTTIVTPFSSGEPESSADGTEIVLVRTRDMGARAIDMVLLNKEETIPDNAVELQMPLVSGQ